MSTAGYWVEPYLNTFQQRIHQEKERLKLTWTELAKRCDLPYQTLWRIANARNPDIPKQEQVRKLARGLRVPWAVLQAEVARAWIGWEFLEEETEEDRVIMLSIKELDDKERRLILAMIHQLRRGEGE